MPSALLTSFGGLNTEATLPPAPQSPVVAQPFTGDYRIDTLLAGLGNRWNKDAALGTGATLSYSFMAAKPTYGGTDSEGDTGFQPFTTQQRDAVRGIFARLSTETGLQFQEVQESGSAYGQLRFGNNTQANSAGYAYLPYSTGDEKDGDVWINDADPANLTAVTPGSSAYSTLVHEIGHALGLKHPGDYNAGEPASSAPGNFLGAAEDSTTYSVMSYREAPGGVQREWFGIYDLFALRTLYGGGAAGTGDSSYRFSDSAGTLLSTLFDASGIDLLDLSAVTTNTVVDLRPGGHSSFGRNGSAISSQNLSIDLATTIENLVGGDGVDQVTGNTAANQFTLRSGNDTADGGAGTDHAVFSGTRASYSVTRTASGSIIVTDSIANRDGNDTLTNVERLVFTDVQVAFDTAGNAGKAYRLYQAAFNRTPDTAGLGYQMKALDGGLTVSQVAANFIASPEFNASYGALDNTQFVTQLYQNVLHRSPDAGGLAFHVANLAAGTARADVLVGFSESPENQAALIGVIEGGMVYTV